MLGDIIYIFKWWLYILLIGILFLPVAEKSFRGFFDKGYALSKVFGILILSYSAWLLSSLGVTSLNRGCTLALALAAFTIMYLFTKGFSLKAFIAANRRMILLEEFMFLILLIVWSYVRGLKPDIFGLEKFMDLGFVNAVLRASHMPPIDIWFAGKPINYYYFGHFACAFLTILTNIEPAVSYNLMIATLLSLSFVLTFSTAGNLLFHRTKVAAAAFEAHVPHGYLNQSSLKKVITAGLISASLLTFGGNLHGFIYGHAKLLPGETEYYYPQSTRYIGYNPPTDDKTIHEFPIYSFVVSDLHGHVSDMPFVLTFIALLLSLFFSEGADNRLDNGGKLLLLSLLISAMYMTNTWDYPIYITVMLILLYYKNLRSAAKPFFKTLMQAAAVIGLSQILVLPFTANFKSISSGVGLVHYRTPLYQLLVLWGHQLFFAFCFIGFTAAAVVKYIGEHDNLGPGRDLPVPDILCLILTFCAMGLVLMPEIVFVRDIYYNGYHRANTMFKLTYQAFIMFGIVTGYIAVRLVSEAKTRHLKYPLVVAFAVMYLLPMSYLPLAIKGFYGSIKPSNYKGIYGLNFLKEQHPGDYEAVKWLNENVKGQPTILEANGDSYTGYCRISAVTGLPTVQGWYVHEWLWRNDPNEPRERGKEVETVYESQDLEKTLEVIRKYDIQYIIIGDLERQKFEKLNEEKLLKLGETVFESGGTRIIKVRANNVHPYFSWRPLTAPTARPSRMA